MLSPVRLSSVVSVVCNVRAPYSGGSNFRQYFYGIWYLDHPLTSTENFKEIIPGAEAGGVAKYSNFGPIEGYILKTVQDRRSVTINMSFRLVPKSVTFNDLERRNGRYFALLQRIPVVSWAHCVKVTYLNRNFTLSYDEAGASPVGLCGHVTCCRGRLACSSGVG